MFRASFFARAKEDRAAKGGGAKLSRRLSVGRIPSCILKSFSYFVLFLVLALNKAENDERLRE